MSRAAEPTPPRACPIGHAPKTTLDAAGRTARPAVDPDALRAETERFERCLAEVEARAAGPVEGVFGPGSAVWRLLRELSVPLFGLRAVLLQIAHPAIATAGAVDSDVRRAFLPRARRTFSTMYTFFFGDLRTALARARQVHRLHLRVRGAIVAEASPRCAGAAYRATDPELLLWVLATLIETTFHAHDALREPLDRATREQFYREMQLVGLLSGIPRAAMPGDLAAFERYFDATLQGALEVGPVAGELADFLFDQRWSVLRFDEVWAAGLLPPALRAAYGLPWSRPRRVGHAAMLLSLRTARRLLPDALRYVPAYHQAELRLALARGARPTRAARWIDRLDAWSDLPLSLAAHD